MREEHNSSLWSHPNVIITTNGTINSHNELVMGKGCALEAKLLYPWIPGLLGNHVRYNGNVPTVISLNDSINSRYSIITLPVKHHWKDRANLKLICDSLPKVVAIVDTMKIAEIVVPRAGCGAGKLSWDVVGPIMHAYLDDRFICVGKV